MNVLSNLAGLLTPAKRIMLRDIRSFEESVALMCAITVRNVFFWPAVDALASFSP